MYGSPQDLIGTTLDDTYLIERVIGEGAYGVVYAATHVRLQSPRAVKVLRSQNPNTILRFYREAKIASSLGSRFIVQVMDFNEPKSGAPYLVMEYLDGEDLATRLKREKQLSLTATLTICEQVSMALSVAHKHQIVHRDLKPQNIFFSKTEDEGEVVKVIDFGISKILGEAGTTQAGQLIGTPLYMSPEQIRGHLDEIDARTDVYALAAVLYEVLGGKPAYHASNMFELAEKISGPTMPPPLSAQLEIPPEVDEVLVRAMAKYPADRPRTITEFYNLMSNAIRTQTKVEAQTPAAAIVGTHALETMYATGMVASPLWRGRGPAGRSKADELRFAAPDGGFVGGDVGTRTLKLADNKAEYFIGSVAKIGDIHNDLALPHRQVSRNSVRVTIRDKRVFLRREPRCSVPVRVGLSILERGEERPLHHGQSVTIGVVAGVFHDGRYVPVQVPAQAVDEQTGLLGREGLAWEVALAARLGERRQLVLATPTGQAARDERIACRVAEAWHAQDATTPVGRFESYAAAIVPADADMNALARAAQVAVSAYYLDHSVAARLLVGHLEVGDSSDEAGARIDEARGALNRLASTGQDSGLVDLAEHRVALYEPAGFLDHARELAQTGGEIGLLALDERDQLDQLGDRVFAALDLELLQIAGHAATSRTVFCRPAAGVLAFASPDAAEPLARQIAAEWHSRGPVRNDVLEVERSLAIDTPDIGEVVNVNELNRCAADLAAGGALGAGVDSLPLPIAVPARNAASATNPLARATCLVATINATWRFFAIALSAMSAAARRTARRDIGAGRADPRASDDAAQAGSGQPDDPWRRLAVDSARNLLDAPSRVADLASALFDADGPKPVLRSADQAAEAMQRAFGSSYTLTNQSATLSHRSLPRVDFAQVNQHLSALERHVAELLRALRPLRGWALVAVTRVDRVDVFGDSETVEYIDYSGTYERGTTRQVTLVKDLRIGPFVYLTRFAEGIVVPLEPHLRLRPDKDTGAPELYWAETQITEPGTHSYVSILTGDVIDDPVTAKQIPRAR